MEEYKDKNKIISLLHPLELVASFKIQNLSQFFSILTFDELKILWLPLYKWFRDFVGPSYRVNVCERAKSLQSWPNLCNPTDCSSPGSSVHGDSPGKNIGVGSCALLQGIFPSSQPRMEPTAHVFYLSKKVLYHVINDCSIKFTFLINPFIRGWKSWLETQH